MKRDVKPLDKITEFVSIEIDYRMAQSILDAFGGEPGVVTVARGNGFDGDGVYLWYSDYPEEGAMFIGSKPDDEALSDEEQRWKDRAEELLRIFRSMNID